MNRGANHYSRKAPTETLGRSYYKDPRELYKPWTSLGVDFSKENIIPKDDTAGAYMPSREPKSSGSAAGMCEDA